MVITSGIFFMECGGVMEAERIRTTQITDFQKIEMIYHSYMKEDFPPSERKPLFAIREMWRKGIYDCYELSEEGQLRGYAFYVKQKSGEQFYSLLDYLAILSQYRGQGYGSVFLRQLSSQIQDVSCSLVEVEDPSEAQDEPERKMRLRRLAFYLENGYQETGLTARVFGVVYRVLATACRKKYRYEEFRDIFTSIYKTMVPGPMYAMNIKVLPEQSQRETGKR